MKDSDPYHHLHASCGGHLEYHHTSKVKGITKDFYYCDQCKHMVACTIFPSYEEMVLRKQLIVEFEEVKRVKIKHGKWLTKKEMRQR